MFAKCSDADFDANVRSDQWLFLDMNSFFASVEQQEQPHLRGKPVAVAPMLSDATCVIAASYAAKPFGVKTGTNLKVAKQMCPDLTIVEARPQIYIDYHRRLIETIKEELPDPHTLSVDEIACKLWSNENTSGDAVRLAVHLKERLRKELGSEMFSSVGIAPNVFLAKVAADLYKPNGLTLIHSSDLPKALCHLSLRDLPGIGRNMHAKLHASNIHTVSQLYSATEHELGLVWGGVVGCRWWYMLRGSNQADYAALAEAPPREVSNSHVIEPALRTDRGAETILLRLMAKAAERLRMKGRLACRMQLSVSYQAERMRKSSWKVDSGHIEAAGDMITWLPIFRRLWSERPELDSGFVPKKVGVTFGDLVAAGDISGHLFEIDKRLSRLSNIVDSVTSHYKQGPGMPKAVDVASTFWLNKLAPERIAFRKISDDDRERRNID
jgi:DNA polymerase-4